LTDRTCCAFLQHEQRANPIPKPVVRSLPFYPDLHSRKIFNSLEIFPNRRFTENGNKNKAPVVQLFAPNHIGGRKLTMRKMKSRKNGFIYPGKWPWAISTIAAVLLFLSPMIMDSGRNPSYVYYSSSVYESTVVQSNGKVESSRQERFESNLPELIRQQSKQDQSRIILRENDIDQQIRDEINSMLRFQKTILDDFF
jgi:hypothetical protein